MLKDIQRFIPGKTPISARTMNELVREVQRLGKISVGNGLLLSDNAAGLHFSVKSNLAGAVLDHPFRGETDPEEPSGVVIGRNREDSDYPFTDTITVGPGRSLARTTPDTLLLIEFPITQLGARQFVYYEIDLASDFTTLSATLKANKDRPVYHERPAAIGFRDRWNVIIGSVNFSGVRGITEKWAQDHFENIVIDDPIIHPFQGFFTKATGLPVIGVNRGYDGSRDTVTAGLNEETRTGVSIITPPDQTVVNFFFHEVIRVFTPSPNSIEVSGIKASTVYPAQEQGKWKIVVGAATSDGVSLIGWQQHLFANPDMPQRW